MGREKYVIVVEYAKGNDKGVDGFRVDTKPILNAIKRNAQCEGEIVFYSHKKRKGLFEYIEKFTQTYDVVIISRINPGNLKKIDEYFVFLNRLSQIGIDVHTHPDVMINLNFKDILYKLRNTAFCDAQSEFFKTFEELEEKLPDILTQHKKYVLKINYGSTGKGVYLLSLNDNGSVVSTEAVDNVKYYYDDIYELIATFENKFEDDVDGDDLSYFHDKSGFVGCRYLPRIEEGEVRVIIIHNRPIKVVHKKPAQGEFSATLFSGADYTYEDIDNPKWKEVIELTCDAFDELQKYLNGQKFPLIWTMDYILDYDENGEDKYILSEINCSCVGISTQLDLAEDIGKVFR